MSIQACDDNNDKIIYINSTFRTAGTISDYTIQFDKKIDNVEYIELIDTTVEYSDVIFRNGGMKFSITRYNIVTLNNVNVLTEAGILTLVILLLEKAYFPMYFKDDGKDNFEIELPEKALFPIYSKDEGRDKPTMFRCS